ncbi:uncharacterized protein A1O5_09533 [Cladophialophora psammophila CBS 110553]|uniref:VOC domain-containing protein n=1 Tax=Cladophialophora psammophila CBS 110553 TaxID=1182543 RepID=W9WRA2_9EURO|nr:uncharacterized protein A1O5_09533 [Cladophialophora psammophila CBS 110553]EXJ67520.1 hypothetical protein A1O5_09533 [Cladophialophora psammophila CBS 110553]
MATAAPSPHAGWVFNQSGIRVSNLEKSISFYQEVLGLSLLQKVQADTFTIAFMGYVPGGVDNPGLELDREGIVELIWSETSGPLITNSKTHDGFGFIKLMFTVPDIMSAMEHMKKFGVKVLKYPGTTDEASLDVVARAIGAEPSGKGRNQGFWHFVGPIAFVEDPDGYYIELMQQDHAKNSLPKMRNENLA